MTASVDRQPSWMGESGAGNRILQKPRCQSVLLRDATATSASAAATMPATRDAVLMTGSGRCVALSDGADQLWPVSHPR